MFKTISTPASIMSFKKYCWVLCFAFCIFFYLPVFAICDSGRLSAAVSLMAKRASLMKAVAANKWYHAPNHQAVVYSPKQEISVLNHAYSTAKVNQLNPLTIMIFSQIQIDVSKQIEMYWINDWNSPKTPSHNKPTQQSIENLDTLRVKISEMDASLYPKLKSSMRYIRQCHIKQIIPIFDNTFSSVTGIPKEPNYLHMLAKAFKNIGSE